MLNTLRNFLLDVANKSAKTTAFLLIGRSKQMSAAMANHLLLLKFFDKFTFLRKC